MSAVPGADCEGGRPMPGIFDALGGSNDGQCDRRYGGFGSARSRVRCPHSADVIVVGTARLQYFSTSSQMRLRDRGHAGTSKDSARSQRNQGYGAQLRLAGADKVCQAPQARRLVGSAPASACVYASHSFCLVKLIPASLPFLWCPGNCIWRCGPVG